MAMLNARCDNCGYVFPSGIVVDNVTEFTMIDVKAGPCPRCGDSGSLILNNRTFDVVNERLTVRRGAPLSPIELVTAMSALTTFQETQENRQEAEQQIAQIAPQLKRVVPLLSVEKLVLIISMLLALISMWQQQPETRQAAADQIEEIVRVAKQEATRDLEEDIATAFRLYETGKQSTHALQKKILRFFPKLEASIRGMSYGDIVGTLALIIIALERWKPKGKLKDFQPSEEFYAEIIAEIKGLRADLKSEQGKENSNKP